jgi:glycosidase
MRRPWNETRWNELYFARTGKSTGVQYYNLDYLQDLNQENSTLDSYLKTAAEQFQNNGADAFRLDALKSVPWCWLPSTRTTRLDTASRARIPRCRRARTLTTWVGCSTAEA